MTSVESFHVAEDVTGKAHSGARGTGTLHHDTHSVGMTLSPVPYVGSTMRYSTVGASMEGTPIVAMAHTRPDLTPTVSEGFSEYMARAAVRSTSAGDMYHRHRMDVAERDGTRVRAEPAKPGNNMHTESGATVKSSNSAAKEDDALGRPSPNASPKHPYGVAHSTRPPQLFVAKSHNSRRVASYIPSGMEYPSSGSARDGELKRASSQLHSAHTSDRGIARPVSKDRAMAKERYTAPAPAHGRMRVAGGGQSRHDDVSSYDDSLMCRESRDGSILSKEGSVLDDLRNSSLTGHAVAERILHIDAHTSKTSKNKFEIVRDASPPGFSASLTSHMSARNDLPSVSSVSLRYLTLKGLVLSGRDSLNLSPARETLLWLSLVRMYTLSCPPALRNDTCDMFTLAGPRTASPSPPTYASRASVGDRQEGVAGCYRRCCKSHSESVTFPLKKTLAWYSICACVCMRCLFMHECIYVCICVSVSECK